MLASGDRWTWILFGVIPDADVTNGYVYRRRLTSHGPLTAAITSGVIAIARKRA